MPEIKLDYPIKVDGKETTVLNMRRAKARDMIAADSAGPSPAEKEVRLFANLCEIPPDAVEELDMADYMKVQEVYQSFLSSVRGTPAR